MTKISISYFESPLGILLLGANNEGVLFVSFIDTEKGKCDYKESGFVEETNVYLSQLENELLEYFKGSRKEFTVQLKFEGTDFHNKIWSELQNIPFGESRTYKQQALTHGDLKAIRAVASANGKNKHAIVIPCHRVIGSDGSLTGYAGGKWRKKWLLEFEQKHSGKATQQKLF